MARIDIGQLSQELDKVKTWLESQKLYFENAQKSVEKFQVDTLSSFQGEAGDSVRAYAKEVYQPIHMEMMKVESELRPVIDTITNEGKSRFGDNGIVDEEYIQEWSFHFNKYAHQLVDLTQDVNRDLRSVADIIDLELLKTDELEEIHYNTKRHCQRTIEQIDEFDRETNAKIQPIQASVLRLQNMVQEVSSKAPSMSGYQSGSFKFSMLSAMKQYSEEDKKQFVENMKEMYGFTDAEAEQMYKIWEGIQNEYSNYSEQEKGWLFNSILGRIGGYNGANWDVTAGKLPDGKSADDLLSDFGLSVDEQRNVKYIISRQHALSSTNAPDINILLKTRNTEDNRYLKTKLKFQELLGRNLTDAEFEAEYSSIYLRVHGKNDFVHQSITVAAMLNNQGTSVADVRTLGHTKEAAGWLGDVTDVADNPAMDTSDYKSDLDAYNISSRMNNGKSFVENMNQYNTELINGEVNRAQEFKGNYGGIENIRNLVYGLDGNEGSPWWAYLIPYSSPLNIYGADYYLDSDLAKETTRKFIENLENNNQEFQ